MTFNHSYEKNRISFREIYFPLSKRKKENFIKRVKSIVTEYKKKIQDKTDIDLGNIEVKSYRYFTTDALEELERRMIISGKIDESKLPFLLKYIGKPFLEFLRICREDWVDLTVIGSQGRIYVPFGFSAKTNMYWEQFGKNIHLEQKVVHELSHILWNKIRESEDSPEDLQCEKIWNEGFATYCDSKYFKDLYPPGYELMNGKRPAVYENGRKKVDSVIRERGDSALFEIPNRWTEFEKSLPALVN